MCTVIVTPTLVAPKCLSALCNEVISYSPSLASCSVEEPFCFKEGDSFFDFVDGKNIQIPPFDSKCCLPIDVPYILLPAKDLEYELCYVPKDYNSTFRPVDADTVEYLKYHKLDAKALLKMYDDDSYAVEGSSYSLDNVNLC